MSFESSVERLEAIVETLEHEELTLDRALALFEEGIQRLRDASAALARTEAAVQVLRERADGILETTDLRA